MRLCRPVSDAIPDPRLSTRPLRPLREGMFAHYFSRLDFDPPRRRLALCTWSGSRRCWLLERASGVHGWTELHTLGEMLFGESPWRRSLVLRVFGRLGSVEAAVARLAPPSPSFVYEFEFELDVTAARPARRAKYSPHAWAQVEAAYYGEDV